MALTACGTNGQVWIKTDLNETSIAAFEKLHRQCDGASNVGMILGLDNLHAQATNPSAAVASIVALVHKAVGSNLKAVTFPTNIFLTNKRGYPTLSKTHKSCLPKCCYVLAGPFGSWSRNPPAIPSEASWWCHRVFAVLAVYTSCATAPRNCSND